MSIGLEEGNGVFDVGVEGREVLGFVGKDGRAAGVPDRLVGFRSLDDNGFFLAAEADAEESTPVDAAGCNELLLGEADS